MDDYLATLELDTSGQLDVPRLLSLTRERRERRPLADLILDFGELGSILFEHERHANPQTVDEKLRALVTEKRVDAVRRRVGSYTQLLETWFVPVGQCLGYEVEPLEEAHDPPPTHAASTRLLVTERRDGKISKRCKRVLVLLDDMPPDLGDELFSWIDRQCRQHGVERAVISDGMGWAEHRWRSRLPLKVWNLGEVLSDREAFIEFLRDVAEGV
jgi:hypothetical protein